MSETKDYPPYLDYPKPRRKQTNADKIRSMTDEELVYIFMRIADGNSPVSIRLSRDFPDPYMKSVWLDWLKREVEE